MIPRFASTNAVYPINESMLEVLEMGEEMFYEAVWNNSGSTKECATVFSLTSTDSASTTTLICSMRQACHLSLMLAGNR